jgi:hypothetical protein
MLECISGIETGRTWNPAIVAANGRVGLFQFDRQSWEFATRTDTNPNGSIPWDEGKAAKDPHTAATVAVARLYRALATLRSPMDFANVTEADIREAIDRFGENDDKYGQAVMDCSKKLLAGDFEGAYGVMYQYANWKRNQP